MRLWRWTQFVAIAAALALSAPSTGDATIDSASVVQRGAIVERHFGLHGTGLSWALSAHGNELWIDLAHTRINLPPRPLYGHETAPVEAVRAIYQGGTRSRLVIQVGRKTDYAVGQLPHELLIRLAPAGPAPDLAPPGPGRSGRPGAAGRRPPAAPLPPPAAARPAPVGSAAGADSAGQAPDNATPGHPVVVIDPGHGGYDSGTEAGAPLLGKDLSLEISLRLKSELEQRGVHAILTRTGDYFVTLGDRTALANKAGADLFISIHLNSSSDFATSG